MATFEVTSPDGAKYQLTAPDGVSEQDALKFVQANHDKLKPLGVGQTKKFDPGTAKPSGNFDASTARPANDWDVASETPRRSVNDILGKPTVDEILGPSDPWAVASNEPAGKPKTWAEHQATFPEKLGAAFADKPGVTYGSILPFARDEKTGETSFAFPEAIRSPMRGFAEMLSRMDNPAVALEQPTTPDEAAALLTVAGPKSPASTAGRVVEQAPAVERNALATLTRRFEQDAAGGGPTAQEAMERLAQARARGTPLTVADIGGENVQALAGNIARQPGPARNALKQFFDQRAEGASDRLDKAVQDNVATGSMRQTSKALIDQRAAAARPNYQAMENLQNIWSPRLQQFLEDPEIKKGLSEGYRLERLDALAENRPFDPSQLGIDLDAEGNVVFKKTPNMRALDMGKRGLDSMIAGQRDELTGRLTPLGRSLEKVRKSYLDEIDSLDTKGVYKAARQSWAGPSASLDALRAGRTMFNRSPDEVAEEVAKLSPGDKEFYKLGVADKLREEIAKRGVTASQVRDLAAGSRNNRIKAQVRPLFDSDEAFKRFIGTVTDERDIYAAERNIFGGSQTAARVAEDQGADLAAMARGARGLAHLATGNWFSAAHNLVNAKRDLGLRPNPRLNMEIGRLLTGPQLRLAAPPAPTNALRDITNAYDTLPPAIFAPPLLSAPNNGGNNR